MSTPIKGLGKLPQTNIFDAVPDFTKTVHVRENTPENEKHLNDNRQKFTGQCAIVLSVLLKGGVLSSYTAMVQYHISYLPIRIKDLKDSPGFMYNIEDQQQFDDKGKKTRNKIWFIRECIDEKTAVKYKIEWKK